MDPLSAASGIAGIISLADLVIGKTIKYVIEVKHAQKSILAFLDETRDLLGALKAIEHTSKLYIEDGLVEDPSVQTHVDACFQLLEDIRKALKESELRKSPLKKLRRELLWPFNSAKTEELVKSLERQKQTLNLAFNAANWLAASKSNEEQALELKALNHTITSKHLSEEHKRMFSWLGDVNHTKLQQNGTGLRSNLKEQTGKWFLDGPQFRHWLQTERAKLWVHGIPGAGKTVLTSTIIQELSRKLSGANNSDEEGDVLAYFYCDFRDRKTTDSWNIVGSLVKQLAHQNRHCLHDLEDFYRQYNPAGPVPKSCNPEKLAGLLYQMAQNFDGDVMIIVDGLDEIEGGREEAIELLQSLATSAISLPTESDLEPQSGEFQMASETSTPIETCSRDTPSPIEPNLEVTFTGQRSSTAAGQGSESSSYIATVDSISSHTLPRIKLLFVSRTQTDIEVTLQGFEKQVIEAKQQDLLLYVASEIDYRMAKRKLRFRDRSLKEEIIDELVKSAQGMFRWVACQIEYLCTLLTDKAKRKALKELPRDLPQTYDRILRAVDENHVALVHKTLQWIIFAAEPLPVKALLEALAVSEGQANHDEDLMTEEEVLLQCCSSLVKKSQSVQGALELAHFTVKQYLMEIDSNSAREIAQYRINENASKLLLAQTCLTYLNFRSFERGPAKTLEEFHDMELKRPFIRHASQHWDYYAGSHFKNESIKSLVQTFFNPSISGQFRFWNQLILVFESKGEEDIESEKYKACMEATPLHWAALLALPDVSEFLIQHFSPSRESGLGTPMHCALVGGVILRHGPPSSTDWAKLRIKEFTEDKLWRSTMRLRTFKLFVDRSADLNHQSPAFTGRSLLLLALQITDKDTDFVSPLLERGAKIRSPAIECSQDMLDATTNNTPPGVLALVNSCTESNLDDSDRVSFMAMAANLQSVQEERAVLLRGQTLTATMNAAEKKKIAQSLNRDTRIGLISNVQMWLGNLRDSLMADEFAVVVQKAFHLAVEYNWRDIVELFLDHGTKVDRQSFHLAVRHRTSRIVDILLEHDCNSARQEDLFEAIRLGEYEILMSLLRAAGIDTALADDHGSLPIHEALADDDQAGSPGRTRIIKELVELEPSLTACNFNGDLPIHLAARLGLHDVVQAFLDRSSPADAENYKGERPTHLACLKDSTKTLQLLLQANADINAKRKGVGNGPLHYAAAKDAGGCARLLIDAGADLEQLGALQHTPLVVAAMNHNWKTSEIFIQAGAKINAMDPDTHSTVLTAAAEGGAIDIIELLREQQPDWEKQTLYGETPLFLAAANGHIEIVDLLLKSNANVDGHDGHDGRDTPLHTAIYEGFADVAKLLLDHDANLESFDTYLLTPLMLASSRKQWKTVEVLILKGAKVNVQDIETGYTPLIEAASEGKAEIVKSLLMKGAEVNQTTVELKYTALISACRKGSLPTIKILVERGADINARDGTAKRSTALVHAIVRKAGSEVVQYLLEHGANASDKDADDGSTALMLAVQYGDITTVRTLLVHGANADAQAHFTKHTAILLAVYSVKPQVCKLLLEHGVDLSLMDSRGRTVAHQIARAADSETLKCFLAHEVDWERSENVEFDDFEKDSSQLGISPLHLAAKYNFSEFINTLCDRKLVADVDPQCGGNIRPIHFAAEVGQLAAVEALLARGADVNAATTVKGRTALHLAAANGHSQCVSALIRGGAAIDILDRDGCIPAALTSQPLISHTLKLASNEKESAGRRGFHSSDTNAMPEATSFKDPRALKLIDACEKGNLQVCRQLLSLGVDCNGIPGADYAPLLIAMRQPKPNYELIHFLIDSGADIHSHTGPKAARHGYQPIHYATCYSSPDTLRKLLNNDARMSEFGVEPVHLAAMQGKVMMLEILLEFECKHAKGPAHRMLNIQVRDQLEFPKKCLDKDTFAVGQLSTGTALHLAAWAGKHEAATKLLEYGADVNAIDANGCSPLHQAVDQGHLKTVKLLLDAGADISSRTSEGCSPFLTAASRENIEVLDELVLRSADIMAVDVQGRGAAHYATYQYQIKVLHRLHELGVPFDRSNIYGDNALFAGLRSGFLTSLDEDTIQFLIEHTPLQSGESPVYGNLLNAMSVFDLSTTSARFVKQILKRLSEANSQIDSSAYINNFCSLYGTPLYFSSYRGEIETMDLLLDAGANLSLSRGPLGSALNAACAMGRVDAIRWLLQRGGGPVEDNAMKLASKYESATKLLLRYKEMGPPGLIEEPTPVIPRRTTALNKRSSLEPIPELPDSGENETIIPVTLVEDKDIS